MDVRPEAKAVASANRFETSPYCRCDARSVRVGVEIGDAL
jgi:hypothetical protein